MKPQHLPEPLTQCSSYRPRTKWPKMSSKATYYHVFESSSEEGFYGVIYDKNGKTLNITKFKPSIGNVKLVIYNRYPTAKHLTAGTKALQVLTDLRDRAVSSYAKEIDKAITEVRQLAIAN